MTMSDDPATIGVGWTLANFASAIHRGGVALWAWSPARRVAQLDSLCQEFWSLPSPLVGIDDLFDRVNAEDRHGMERDWFASVDEAKAYSFDFRIGEEPHVRWISARGMGGEDGRVGEWMQAIFIDITDRKRAEDAERLLTAELAHRVSNMFTVARALTTMVARDATSTPLFAEELSRRFGVLHEATALATRSRESDHGTIKLQELAERILSPYRRGSDIAIAFDDGAVVDSDEVNHYAMIFHELATNSAKYGALSGAGTLQLAGRVEPHELRVSWNEDVPSSVPQASSGTGFGSRLLKQTIERSLKGTFTRSIDEHGLHFGMFIPRLPSERPAAVGP